jgi:hypothetical protein
VTVEQREKRHDQVDQEQAVMVLYGFVKTDSTVTGLLSEAN